MSIKLLFFFLRKYSFAVCSVQLMPAVWQAETVCLLHLFYIFQVASVNSRPSVRLCAKPTWMARPTAVPLLPRSWASVGCASALTPRTSSLISTGIRAAPQTRTAARYPTRIPPSLWRSCRTFTWAVPRTPLTLMCWRSTGSSISST